MIQLHYYPSTAAMIPSIVMEELGVPFERVLVDKAGGEHRRPEFLKLNPNGLMPVLVDGGLVLYETAAITLHLADRHPQAKLIPELGTDARSHFYKWLLWLASNLQSTLVVYFYPDRWMDEGNEAGWKELQRNAQAKVKDLLQRLEDEVARNGGPWFLGEQYSALDAYVFTMCRWTRNFSDGRARDRAVLGPYLQRMLERPAVQRVLAAEQLKPPYV